ncbi:Arc family DNA-binding protein [Paracoccus versutus]
MDRDDSRPLTRDLAPFGVRMPPELKARIHAAAEANNRSMNAEIIHRLQTTFEMDDYQPVENAHADEGPAGGLFGLRPRSPEASDIASEVVRLLMEQTKKDQE